MIFPISPKKAPSFSALSLPRFLVKKTRALLVLFSREKKYEKTVFLLKPTSHILYVRTKNHRQTHKEFGSLWLLSLSREKVTERKKHKKVQ
ncbi:MAG: hypothetical protein J6036_02565, partial [Clostridia bacterium]|nr:hypothetical protein [Clostridia bacterium]